MTFEDQESIGAMLIGSLLNKNDGEALAGLRAVARKMAAYGMDPHDLGIYDKSKGNEATAAANAIRQMREYADVVNDTRGRRRNWQEKIDTRLAGRKVKGGNVVTISAGAKSVGTTKRDMIAWVKEAGPVGLTRAEVQAKDAKNEGITRRFKEIIDTGTIFEVGDRLVHASFRAAHPQAWAAFEAARFSEIDA